MFHRYISCHYARTATGTCSCARETFRLGGGRSTMTQSVTRRKWLAYARCRCIVVVAVAMHPPHPPQRREHRARRVVSHGAPRREKHALICGSNPRRSRNPRIIPYLYYPAGSKGFPMRSTRAERNAEKPGVVSVRAGGACHGLLTFFTL